MRLLRYTCKDESDYSNRSKRYFSNINALRFFAFLGVFIAHSFATNNSHLLQSSYYQAFSLFIQKGVLGVNFFFVLSGFLITWVLLEEIKSSNTINLRNFYLRRILRIWPLYFLVVGLGLAILFWKQQHHTTFQITFPVYHYFTFTVNFGVLKHSVPYLPLLGILWTISVEEQFYLFWALLIRFFKKHILKLIIGVLITSIIFRGIFIQSGDVIYFHTLSVMCDMAIGALLSYLSFKQNPLLEKWKNISKWLILALYLLFILYLSLSNYLPHSDISNVIERPILALFFAFVLFEQSFCNNSFFKLEKFSILNHLGKISYGLYCFHPLANLILWQFIKRNIIPDIPTTTFFLYPISSLLLTVLLAGISYRYYERYFLKLKVRFY